MRERARFAPSPTGPLHIGGVRTALFSYLMAKKNNGEFILRIEDTDSKRTIDGAEQHIIDSLNWLGLKFDEGPIKQSERTHIYKERIKELIKSGLAYYAFDTASELEEARNEAETSFKYNFLSRKNMSNSLTLSEDEVKSRLEREAYVVRMIIPENETVNVVDQVRGKLSFKSEELEDKIIMKSDGMPTYHFANVVDDYLMKITTIIRGEEWLPSLPFHKLIYDAFGWKMPDTVHLPLILNPSGSGKLSKRDALKNNYSIFPIKWEKLDGLREKGLLANVQLAYVSQLGSSFNNDDGNSF